MGVDKIPPRCSIKDGSSYLKTKGSFLFPVPKKHGKEGAFCNSYTSVKEFAMKKKLFLFVLVTFFVTGCSGGGGGGSTPAPVAVGVTPAPVSTYNITGSVETQSGVPVVGATIRIIDPIVAVTTTDSNGNYMFPSVEDRIYTVTGEATGYNPVSAVVKVSGANATQNFTATEIVIVKLALTKGKLTYISRNATSNSIRKKDLSLSTGESVTVYTRDGTSPEMISLFQHADKFAFAGSNSDGELPDGRLAAGVLVKDMATGIANVIIPSIIYYVQYVYIEDTVMPWPDGSFDITSNGVWTVLPVRFASDTGDYSDIFLIRLGDGTVPLDYIRVTANDHSIDSAPVICWEDSRTGQVGVCYVENGTAVKKQVVDTVSRTPVGAPTLVVSGVVGLTRVGDSFAPFRTMWPNATNTKMAVMKNVNGVSHIVIISMLDGSEICSLGVGENPYWGAHGNDYIIFTEKDADIFTGKGGVLMAATPDCMQKFNIPIPEDAYTHFPAGLSRIVYE